MVDYDKSVGRSGVMKMRDTGTTVEFWVAVGYSGTFWGSVGWSYSSPNGGGSGSFGYPGGGAWVRVGSINVSTSGNVSWTVNATGTSEFGGPHTQTVYISRATVPPAPNPLGIDNIGHTTLRYRFQSKGDGGSAILQWQIGYGTGSGSPTSYLTSTGTSTLSGLSMGVRYYVWSRGRNALGWGPWSARRDATTLAGCRVRVGGAWKDAVPYVKVNGVWKASVPFIKVAGSWKSASN